MFTVSTAVYSTGTLTVYLNGQLLTQGSSEDWVETTPGSGTFTFAVAPQTGDQVTAYYQKQSTTAASVMLARVITVTSSPLTAGAVANTDYVYLVSGTTTITLPTAVANINMYTVKRTGTNTVTVATTSAQTIDGSSTVSLTVQNQSLDFISNGSNWCII